MKTNKGIYYTHEKNQMGGRLMKIDIETLDLSIRCKTCLISQNIKYVNTETNYRFLTETRNFGLKALAELREAIEFYRLNK